MALIRKNNSLAESDEWHTLRQLWERTREQVKGKSGQKPDDLQWEKEIRALYELGIGMEETLRFLYHSLPAEEDFLQWLQNRQQERKPITAQEHVLSAGDLAFWEEQGYLVLKNAVSAAQHEAVRTAIWNFLDASADDPASWYRAHPANNGLMLLFTDHPALQAVRESGRIRKAYEQLYKTNAIYPTIDKVSFNPPETEQFRFKGSPLHWDVSLVQPIPYRLQGLLYLNDVNPSDGAFHCVPGFHKNIGSWLKSLPAGVNPREQALKELNPIAVPGRAGDFIIWHQALPHCATANRGKTPRLVQYLTYLPLEQEGGETREWI